MCFLCNGGFQVKFENYRCEQSIPISRERNGSAYLVLRDNLRQASKVLHSEHRVIAHIWVDQAAELQELVWFVSRW